ncbi:class I SAM-dependent methyltransferase [Methanospirillum sp.]
MEINLLDHYPKTIRKPDARASDVTEEDRIIARQFGESFFDGERLTGYGGYHYHPRFWTDTVKRFQDFYHLTSHSRILDIGCAKGFLIYDFIRIIPGIQITGLDISRYALEHAHNLSKPNLVQGDAAHLPYPNNTFDLVISINTIHNLPIDTCRQAILEIIRVSQQNAFITVDAWRNDEEKRRMLQWNLTAKTYMHVDDWKNLFDDVGYTGDYYWFIAE